MNELIQDLCNSLDDLGQSIIDGTSGNTTFVETYGWNQVPFNKHDIAKLPFQLSTRLKNTNVQDLNEELQETLATIIERIELFNLNTKPYIFNGNSITALPILFSLIQWIETVCHPLITWETVDSKAMPNRLATRLRSIQSSIDSIVPDKESLENQIKLIQDATNASESLPTDLEALKASRNKIDALSLQASELYGKMEVTSTTAK